jgi:hypothetical protein
VDRTHLYAGGSTSAPEEFEAPGPGHLPFWSKRFSSLRLFLVTTPTMLYLGWPYHSILVPNCLCCWQSQLRLAPWLPSRGPTSPSEEATLSRRLLAGMILLAEQQVLSTLIQAPQHSYIGDLVSHPNDKAQQLAHAG